MSGSNIASVPQAVVLMDLALAGVAAEMSDEPFSWLGAPAAKTVTEPARKPVEREDAPALQGVEVELPRPAAKPLLPDSPLSAQAKPTRSAPVMPEIPARVWREGEQAEVVMVVQGAMPDARCQQLARAMLAAVGLKEAALGWVGYEGKVAADALRDEVKASGAAHVLVMGQGPLGILLGRNLGVEGWHAAGGGDTMELDIAVGVTYPLDLLLKQPLFKRLAWQHLLAWGDYKFKNKGV